MITRFGHLCSGDVDLTDQGLEGPPINDRWLSDEHLATAFEKAEHLAQLMDQVGYDTFWMAEHHFQREGFECIPNLLMFSVHLAHLTKNIKFACGFNIAPMWHPLRVAEDFATADILTDGRVIFGLGRGYHSREVDTFGVPSTLTDSDANREIFEEQVEIIFKAFNNQSFSHHSKNYNIPPRVAYRGYELEEITLVPRPRKLPVETWQPLVSGNPRTMDFMVKYGIKGMVGGGAVPGGANHDKVVSWQEALARSGKETKLGGDLIIPYNTWVADTEEKAIAEARPYYEEYVKHSAPFGFVEATEEQVEALADPKRARSAGIPTLEEGIESGKWLCGPPELIKEKLMAIQDAYPGLEEVNIGPPNSCLPEPQYLEQLEWFGKEVMPAFKNQQKTAAPAD